MRILMTAVFVLSMGSPAWAGEVEATGKGGLAFYFLEDDQLNTGQALRTPLESLKLKADPFFTSKELLAYDVSSHAMYLTPEGYKSLTAPFAEPNRVPLRGLPFVLCADGRRCYLASFHLSVSSFGYGNAAINDMFAFRNVVLLHRLGRTPASEDPRNNPHILSLLKEEGLYHEGLSGRLIDFQFSEAVNPFGQQASKLVYTYELKNNDTHPVLVLDPDKTAHPYVFNHFTRILALRPDGSGDSSNGVLTRPKEFEENITAVVARQTLDAFTELAPGQTMKRTSETVGFPGGLVNASTVSLSYVMAAYTIKEFLAPLSESEIESASPLLDKIWWGELKMESVTPKRR